MFWAASCVCLWDWGLFCKAHFMTHMLYIKTFVKSVSTLLEQEHTVLLLLLLLLLLVVLIFCPAKMNLYDSLKGQWLTLETIQSQFTHVCLSVEVTYLQHVASTRFTAFSLKSWENESTQWVLFLRWKVTSVTQTSSSWRSVKAKCSAWHEMIIKLIIYQLLRSFTTNNQIQFKFSFMAEIRRQDRSDVCHQLDML